MKRFLLAGISLLFTCSLFAQVVYDAPERQMPQNVYNAFLTVERLNPQRQELQQKGNEAQLQELNQALALLKGLVVVELGFKGCRPCAALLDVLATPADGGASMLQQWQNKGVKFYQIDTRAETPQNGQKLSQIWAAQSVPVLLLFKDGELMTHDFGLGQMQSRLNGFNANNSASVLDMLQKWTDFALQ